MALPFSIAPEAICRAEIRIDGRGHPAKAPGLVGGREGAACRRNPALLTEPEQAVYQGIKGNAWGQNIRLEQERIAWELAWQALRQAL